MKLTAPIRPLAAASCLLAATSLFAQSAQPVKPSAAIPAAEPTQLTAVAPANSRNTNQQSPARARIDYTENLLTVTANNSSLNQILRDISRLTSMKITGGVTDERVFGKYGPDTPDKILNTLLDGTGSNVLIVQSAINVPAELILTPRRGGATPPNPNSPSFNDSNDPSSASEDTPPQQMARPIPQQPPVQGIRPYTGNPSESPMQNPPLAPATTTTDTTPKSPNGVPTPQQIYEQLQRMRQQQQQPPQQ